MMEAKRSQLVKPYGRPHDFTQSFPCGGKKVPGTHFKTLSLFSGAVRKGIRR
jgi:hypothetical protein